MRTTKIVSESALWLMITGASLKDLRLSSSLTLNPHEVSLPDNLSWQRLFGQLRLFMVSGHCGRQNRWASN